MGDKIDFRRHVPDPATSPAATTQNSAATDFLTWVPSTKGLTPPSVIAIRDHGDTAVMASSDGIVELRPVPLEWLRFISAVRPTHARSAEWYATLFLGRLTSAGGHSRFVELHRYVGGRSESGATTAMYAWIVLAEDEVSVPRVRIVVARPVNGKPKALSWDQHSFEFYEGQKDPNDPSHFEIAYKQDDEKGILDGWLTDDDQIVLLWRDGPLSRGLPR